MKRILIILSLFLFGMIGTTQAYSNVSFSFSFNDALSPYGSWVNVSSYGNCWRPRVGHGWRPYSEGHWIYTDYGPMWDSPEPYGWAVYHYGRWVFSAGYGWIWVPGYDWYPSRVTWAYGDDYLGWSPIYPSPGYSNTNFWLFINRDHFGYRDYSRVYFRGDRVRPLFDRRIVRVQSARLGKRDFERITRRPVQVVSVRERTLEADRHRVRMIVPRHREATAIAEVSKASKKRVAISDNRIIHKSETVKQSQRRNVVTPKYHSTKKVEINRTQKAKPPTRSSTITHRSTVKQSPQKSHVIYSNKKSTVKTQTPSRNYISNRSTIKQSPQKSHVIYSNKKSTVKTQTPSRNYISNRSTVKQSPQKSHVIYSNKKSTVRTQTPSRNYISNRSTVKKSPQKSHVIYSNRSSSQLNRSSSSRTTIKQSPPKSHVTSGKYSYSKREPVRQVNPVKRQEMKQPVRKAPPPQSKRKPPRKH